MDYKDKVIKLLMSKELTEEQKDKLLDIFPELKESDDEIIIKALKSGFKMLEREYNLKGLGGIKFEKILAWLEKQADHAKFINSIQVGDKVTRNEDGMLVNLSQLNRVAKKDEKQGEQKPDNEIKPKYKEGDTIEYIGERKELDTDEHIILYVYDDMYITTWGKKIPFKFQDDYKLVDKQKPVDKVEPKFKVGDWIIKDNYSAQQVKELREEAYILDGSISGVETLPKKYIENNYHLWTIQDAKAGDVLSYRNGQWIFIYKDIVTKDTFKYYALLSERGVSINDTAFSLLLDGITPTTKEQYNQLFQKMKEAGYEWVGDKLELRKIEQKTAEWSEEDKDAIDQAILALEDLYDDCPLCRYDGYKLPYDKAAKRLKSLKYRYTWKPSLAQLNALSVVAKGNAPDDIEEIKSLLNDLKKLTE